MFELANDKLKVEIDSHGAEVKRVSGVANGVDYLWNGDASFWGRTAPVLFPIVGAVANGVYLHEGEEFMLGQHGFARDLAFECVKQEAGELWFELRASEETLVRYPFDFVLRIGYVLEGEALVVKWEVENAGDKVMPFSIGAHPAFAAGPDLEDYYLVVDGDNGFESYVFDNDKGLVKDEKVVVVGAGGKELPLGKELFEKHPTLILEGERQLTLKSRTHEHIVDVEFDGFPYVGIWSPVNGDGEVAPFVCIEPWFGMADTHAESGDIREKKGIQTLEPGALFETQYTMTFK